MSDAPHVWTDRPGPDVMERGETYDRAQQEAWDEYVHVEAPPCPGEGCGKPVKDADWNRHSFEEHGLTSRVIPYGKPNAREAMFMADHREELECQIVAWRERHPGVRLAFLAEGRDRDDGFIWARFRQHDARGRPAH